MAKVVFWLEMVEILPICSSGEDEGGEGWWNHRIGATAWASPGPMEQQGGMPMKASCTCQDPKQA